MALSGNIVGTDLENLNLDPFPQMAYEPFINAELVPTIRYSQIFSNTKIYVIHEDLDLLPGMILLWHGSIASIPSGWALCNGSNGTPDLRNRFVVCANADDSGVAKSTILGGALQTGGAVGHTHTGTTDGHAHNIYGYLDVEEGPGYPVVEDNTSTEYETDTFTTDSEDEVPPFYALAYIMKI